MANDEQFELLDRGARAWNSLRAWERPDLRDAQLYGRNFPGINLTNADLTHADLSKADLRGANLSGCLLWSAKLRQTDLRQAHLVRADLTQAVLRGAKLDDADLYRSVLTLTQGQTASVKRTQLREAKFNKSDFTMADFRKADLRGAEFYDAQLYGARFCGADLRGAKLVGANLASADLSMADLRGSALYGSDLSKANFSGANLSGCFVYGAAVWDVNLQNTIQDSIVITPPTEPTITVDNIAVAQFLHLLIKNQSIRSVIDTITSKVVLILGRFTPDRKVILDRLRDELRQRDYLPVVFDFDQPTTRNFTETVSTLAHLARFIVADITEPRSIPQELQRIVPDLPSVPVQPLIHQSGGEWGMFLDFLDYGNVLPPFQYASPDALCEALVAQVIAPAERRALDIQCRRAARD